MYEKHDYYKQRIRANVTNLLIHVCRQYQNNSSQLPKQSGNQKETIVKDIIRYLQHHFTEKISIDLLSRELGFSYSYLCHIFKEVTTLTIVEYTQPVSYTHLDVYKRQVEGYPASAIVTS